MILFTIANVRISELECAVRGNSVVIVDFVLANEQRDLPHIKQDISKMLVYLMQI